MCEYLTTTLHTFLSATIPHTGVETLKTPTSVTNTAARRLGEKWYYNVNEHVFIWNTSITGGKIILMFFIYLFICGWIYVHTVVPSDCYTVLAWGVAYTSRLYRICGLEMYAIVNKSSFHEINLHVFQHGRLMRYRTNRGWCRTI